MKFFATLPLAFALVGAALADYAAIQKDVTAVNQKLETLNKNVQATDGTDYIKDYGLGQDVQALLQALSTATKDFQDSQTYTVAQAEPIIKLLQTSQKTTKDLVDHLIAIKPGFEKVGVVGLLKSDVDKLDKAVSAFAEAAVSKAPKLKQKEAKAIQSSIYADLDRVKKAYA
ncbi:hypothetical protein ACQY0O_007413 [Thecaphora frezii]